MERPPYHDGLWRDRCVCLCLCIFLIPDNPKGGKQFSITQYCTWTGIEGGWEGGGVESCLSERQPARCRHIGDPRPQPVHSVQVSSKHTQPTQEHYHTYIHTHKLTHTHLTLGQFLLYCKTQVKLDKSHRHTERQFHLRLFCLSASSQLLHADPYYPPATS